MTDGATPIPPSAFEGADGLEGWRVLSEGGCAYFPTPSFAASAAFVRDIAALDDVDGHPPAVDIRRGGVTVRLVTATADHYGMTELDVEISRRISAVAREHGLDADASALQDLLVIPGAPSDAAILPFWRAVLGYEPRPDSPEEDLVDPHDRGPAFWFESMDEPRGDGGGAIHVAIWLPREQAEARVAAAVAAGGRIVRDFSPSWWTLADAAGNEADVASVSGRE